MHVYIYPLAYVHLVVSFSVPQFHIELGFIADVDEFQTDVGDT
jgi:hypothetical protein